MAEERFKPTLEMAKEAEHGLKLREEYNRGGTAVGVARAVQLKNQVPLPIETVARIYSYFKRHVNDKQAEGWNMGEKGYPSAGKVAWCLSGDTPILMADNSEKTIADIVNNKIQDDVVCYDELNNRFITSPITDWFCNPSSVEDYLIIGFDKRERHTLSDKTFIKVTKEHPILTKNGWKKAGEITLDDEIATINKWIDNEGEAIIIGTVLGDSCSSFLDSGNTNIKWSHCNSDRDWSLVKKTYLEPIMTNTFYKISEKTSYYKGKSINSQSTIGCSTVTLKRMTEFLKKYLYDESGRKVIKKEALDKMGMLGLTILIGDDGSLHMDSRDSSYTYRIHTECFDDISLNTFVQWLYENISPITYDDKFGRKQNKGKIYIQKRNNTNGKYICVSGCWARGLGKILGEYLDESMIRKIPPKYRNFPNKLTGVKCNYTDAMEFTKVQRIEKLTDVCSFNRNPQLFTLEYDITVRDYHNFVASGMVVHNCLWGGDPGRTWATRIWEKHKEDKLKGKSLDLLDFITDDSSDEYVESIVKTLFEE